MIDLHDITIRTTLRPGDLGYLIYLHGHLYGNEYKFGISFEMYVAQSVNEFYQQYDPQRDGLWICEHGSRIVGFLLLMHRGLDTAQLRYFMAPGQLFTIPANVRHRTRPKGSRSVNLTFELEAMETVKL